MVASQGSKGATDATAPEASGWPWILIALGPVILAITTWDTSFRATVLQDWIRGFGLPLTIIEAIFVGYSLHSGFEPFKMLRSAPAWAQAALIAIVVIALFDAAFVAPDGLLSLLRTSLSVVHLMFGLSVAYVFSVTPESERIWRWILAGLCGYVLIFLIFVASIPYPEKLPWQAWQYFGLGVRNIRHAGFFFAVGAAVALGLAVKAKGNREYFATAMIASVMLAAAFWSGSRGPIIGVWGGFAITLFTVPSLRSKRAVLALIASTGVGAMLSLLRPAPSTLYGLSRIQLSTHGDTLDQVGSGRLELWRATWREILNRPLLGHGEGQLHLIIPEARHVQFHPHDLFLQLAFQWGLIGLLCFFALAAVLVARAFRSVGQHGDYLTPAFMVAATLLFMSLNDGILFFTYPQMMVALSVAALAAVPTQSASVT